MVSKILKLNCDDVTEDNINECCKCNEMSEVPYTVFSYLLFYNGLIHIILIFFFTKFSMQFSLKMVRYGRTNI